MPLQQIIVNLGRLTKAELQTVKLTVEHLLGSCSSPSEDDTVEQELFLFYTQISHRMEEKGISILPWSLLKRRPLYREYQRKFGSTEKYTLRYFGKLNRHHRQRLYNLYASVLVNYIDQHPKIPLRTTTALRMVENIPSLMSKSFPGYAESGLLHLILELNQGNGPDRGR